MKDTPAHCSTDSPHIQPYEPGCQRHSDTTNALHVSDHGSELNEPFKLSMLNSPLAHAKPKTNLKVRSALSSPCNKSLASTHQTLIQPLRDGKPNNLDTFIDEILRKRENYASETEPLLELQHNFTKQLHRVKYYWRGTSLNYPFTYMRLRRNNNALAYEEDYSGKKVNVNDGIFN